MVRIQRVGILAGRQSRSDDITIGLLAKFTIEKVLNSV